MNMVPAIMQSLTSVPEQRNFNSQQCKVRGVNCYDRVNLMLTKNKNITSFSVIGLFTILSIVCTTSCSSLKPIIQNDSLQTLTYNDIGKFDGDYEIFPDSASNTTLAYALTYSN